MHHRKNDSANRICKQSIRLLIAIVSVSVFLFPATGRASDPYLEGSTLVQPAKYQLTPLQEPRIGLPENAGGGNRLGSSANNAPDINRTTPTGRPISSKSFLVGDAVSGQEALRLSSSDLGNLLKKSSNGLSVGVQSKTPIVSDPRVRGSRVGALAASGSHWVPARADLDTILSKFDSRQISKVDIVPGPFSVLYGPGFAFTDVQLLQSPRYQQGVQSHGTSDLEYKQNGNQFFGQQSVLVGSSDWGARFNYAARSGDDYRAGGGGSQTIPSSYNSQEMTLALGRDWKNDSIEINVLRLDQTNVIFPGYVFDLDNLVTDGYEVTHRHRSGSVWDEVSTDAWYNRTSFSGNAQNQRKRNFFPLLNLIGYVGFTDVDSMSTGYRQSYGLGNLEEDGFRLTVGHDLRYVKQELNEVSSGTTLGLPIPFANRNSPIPKSFMANPGLFVDYQEDVTERIGFRAGVRADYANSNIVDTPDKLQGIGLGVLPASYRNIVGTDQYDRDFALVSGFMTLRRDWTTELSTTVSGGYAERAPTLTELYAAQPFMLMLQNGLNNVTGDPSLQKERLFQIDVGGEFSTGLVKTGVRGFHAWGLDYITYENTRVTSVPPAGEVGQVSLRYVNTDLATLLGAECFGELLPESPVTPFATMRVVDGRDRTRNGRFATTNGNAFAASQKVDGAARGFFSGVLGNNEEPLPGIPPLDARLGLRLHDTSPRKEWNIELAARMVARQDRVATSLLETATSGFTVWDTRMLFRSRNIPGLSLATGVENMFNRRYREHFDFRTASGLSVLQPGTNFYVSTSLSF